MTGIEVQQFEQPNSSKDAENFEIEYVQTVYNQIASHFSQTRYKPWPVVERFLSEYSSSDIGIDVGCGNGKYMTAYPQLCIIGCDYSENLARIAKNRGHEVVTASILELPFATQRFDFALCIAVVHHLSTRERRVAAVRATIRRLNQSGRALFFVWALEQSSSRRGYNETSVQDQFVSWTLKSRSIQSREISNIAQQQLEQTEQTTRMDHHAEREVPEEFEHRQSETVTTEEPAQLEQQKQQPQVFKRYYHLYRQGELEADIQTAGGQVVDKGYDKDNWWAIAMLK